MSIPRYIECDRCEKIVSEDEAIEIHLICLKKVCASCFKAMESGRAYGRRIPRPRPTLPERLRQGWKVWKAWGF